MIQITAQMRVLVAIEPVDGRKYGPSTNMRSFLQIRRPRFKLCFVGTGRPLVSSSA
jgi:hypothetical protein